MKSASAPRITDVALFTHDLDGATDFYVNKLGLELRSYVPGFVDFQGPGVILALWDAALLQAGTGIVARPPRHDGHDVMIACELASPTEVDRRYETYSTLGVEFYDSPADFPWNARCAYFAGPCGELWELFAWHNGGQPGVLDQQNV